MFYFLEKKIFLFLFRFFFRKQVMTHELLIEKRKIIIFAPVKGINDVSRYCSDKVLPWLYYPVRFYLTHNKSKFTNAGITCSHSRDRVPALAQRRN